MRPRLPVEVQARCMDAGIIIVGTKIAIVEDDRLLCRSMALFLQARGARVETYASAEEAGDAVLRGGFDLVISGYLLPGENGLSFLRRVREASPSTATVLIASHAGPDLPKEASAAGIGSVLAKPFSTKELDAALYRFFAGGGSGSKGDIEMV